MTLNDDGDGYTLSTGRQFYANCGIVGVSARDSQRPSTRFVFSEGYDGHEDADSWTTRERQELADFMSALWQRWAAGAV